MVVLVGCGDEGRASLAASSASTTTGAIRVPDVTTTVPAEVSLPPATTTPPPAPLTTLDAGPPADGSGVHGTVLFGPVCPVERIPPDPACAPRPGPARIRLFRADGALAAEGTAGDDGNFMIPVGPGTYEVQTEAATAGPGRGCQAEPAQILVPSGSFVSVSVTCDTGIR
ncbi:MAG: hypothetical protein QOG43_1039 [Actinomycetota bacterium]|nr:hypothetical protein [Actinomycetota bacterium]